MKAKIVNISRELVSLCFTRNKEQGVKTFTREDLGWRTKK